MNAGRALTARYTLTGELVAVSPLHVGAAAPGAVTDLECVRDGLDRLVIPGTSLAGVLRAATTGHHSTAHDSTAYWWGPHLDGDPERDAAAHASRLTITDAPATGPARVINRDGVSIDRITGTAAHRHLYTRQVIATGTRFTFTAWLDVTDPAADPSAAEFVQRLAARLAAGITAGAAGTAGLGRLRLEQPVLRREDFTTPTGLFDALTGGGTAVELTAPAPAAGIVRITIPWTPLGPVMSKAAAAAGEAAAWPALDTDATGNRLALLIPGASVKGILRGHAERIVRTLTNTGLDTPDPLEQLEQAAALPGIGELFGAAADLAADTPGRRGQLSVHELTSTVTIPPAQWQAVRAAAAQPASTGTERDRRRKAFADAVDALNTATAPQGLWFDIAARTAIDRWTGAASDGLLFTALEPHTSPGASVWSPIRLDLDLTSRDGAPVEALLALLLLVVRDLAEGWIGLGFATTRGLGALRADPAAITLTVDTDPDTEPPVSEAITALHGRTLAEILSTPALAAGLDTAWNTLIPEEATAS